MTFEQVLDKVGGVVAGRLEMMTSVRADRRRYPGHGILLVPGSICCIGREAIPRFVHWQKPFFL